MVSSSARVECVGHRAAEGRACCSAVGEQRWRRVQPPSCLTRYSVVARSTECERGASGGAHQVREMVGVWVCGELERACRE